MTLPGNRQRSTCLVPAGYYADKSWANFSSADRERQLEEAFMLENPLTDMTLVMELNFFKLNRAEYYVPVTVKIPGSELAIARRRGAPRTEIDFMSEVKDSNRITYSNMRDSSPITLSEDVADQLAARPIQYQTGFTLLPGDYVIKLLARDTVTGRIGTFSGEVHDSESRERYRNAADQHRGPEQTAGGGRHRALRGQESAAKTSGRWIR